MFKLKIYFLQVISVDDAITADELEANLIENAKLPMIPIDSNEIDYNPGNIIVFFMFLVIYLLYIKKKNI